MTEIHARDAWLNDDYNVSIAPTDGNEIETIDEASLAQLSDRGLETQTERDQSGRVLQSGVESRDNCEYSDTNVENSVSTTATVTTRRAASLSRERRDSDVSEDWRHS